MTRPTYDAIVVGGGFFGCCLGLHLAGRLGQRVVVLEREAELLQRASYANQARVHNGYHYPRSLLTALRCRVNFPLFVRDYAECVVSDFEKYYAVGGHASKVTAEQFRLFCDRVGARTQPAPKEIRALFDPHLVEGVFRVQEVAFDAVKLKEIVERQLAASPVELRRRTEALTVRRLDGGALEVACRTPEGEERLTGTAVLDCTYSRINQLLVRSGLPPIRLKHELTEMPLVRVPDEVRGRGFTMMCGPFFSVMPFPPLGLHTLSHVRYTPHCEWMDTAADSWRDPYELFERVRRVSNFPHMVRDVARYMPCLRTCEYVDSIWEVKTVLPKSEVDDSRPVLYRTDCGLPNLTCILGGKIDNIYDIMDVMSDAAGRRAG